MTINAEMKWQNKVKAWLEERDLKEAWLARQAGISPQRLNKAMKGGKRGWDNVLAAIRIAEQMGISVSELFDDSKEFRFDPHTLRLVLESTEKGRPGRSSGQRDQAREKDVTSRLRGK